MQIFELHFNPNNKEGRLIDTFCYQPEDVYEKRLGALAIGGQFKPTESSNKTFLNNLSYKIKSTYHSLPTRTQEEALREGLKEANNFLEEKKIKKNLHVAVLSIKGNQLQFSKVGSLKILLSRNGEITDIGKNTDDNTSTFGSIVTGKVKKDDKLIVLTEEIYKKFLAENLLVDLADTSPIDDKKLEKVSKIQKEKFPKEAGVCLLVDFSIDTSLGNSKIISKDEFSFKKFTLNLISETARLVSFLWEKTKDTIVGLINWTIKTGKPAIERLFKFFLVVLKDIRRGIIKLLSLAKKKLGNIKIEKPKKEITEKSSKEEKDSFKLIEFIKTEGANGWNSLRSNLKKLKDSDYVPKINNFKIPEDKEKRRNLYLAGLLLLIILIGSFVTHSERSKKLEIQREILGRMKEDIGQITAHPNNFAELKDYYEELGGLIRGGISPKAKAEALRSDIAQKLLHINNTQIIEDPEFLFSTTEIVPSKMTLVEDEIYLYNPFLSSAEKYNIETGEKLIRPIRLDDGGIFSLTDVNGTPYFFSRPDKLIVNDNSYVLDIPFLDHSYQQLASFGEYIYFLERKNNQIVRYHKDNPTESSIWIQERKPGNITSLAIDGSIWALKEDNSIWKYEGGKPISESEIVHREIFPFPERFSLIKTGQDLPLFILEPRNNRVIVSSKEGELITQLIFPNAKNLKDIIPVGENEQIKIYLLDGQEVYYTIIEL